FSYPNRSESYRASSRRCVKRFSSLARTLSIDCYTRNSRDQTHRERGLVMSVQVSFDLSATGVPWLDHVRHAKSLHRWIAALKEYLTIQWPQSSVRLHMNEHSRNLLAELVGCQDADAQQIVGRIAEFVFFSSGHRAPSDDDNFDPLRWALAVRADPEWLQFVARTATQQRVREAAADVLTEWLVMGNGVGYNTARTVAALTSDRVLVRGH